MLAEPPLFIYYVRLFLLIANPCRIAPSEQRQSNCQEQEN